MAKGSNYEREICKRLSLWWTGGRRDDVFWRSAQSGGRATVRSRKGQQTVNSHGDAAAVDPDGAPLTDLFVIEIKRGYSFHTAHDLLDLPEGRKKCQYVAWFDKAEEDCKAAGAFGWWLITRRDRRRPLIWMPHECASCFGQACSDVWVIDLPRLRVLAADLEEYLSAVTRDRVLELAKIL